MNARACQWGSTCVDQTRRNRTTLSAQAISRDGERMEHVMALLLFVCWCVLKDEWAGGSMYRLEAILSRVVRFFM